MEETTQKIHSVSAFFFFLLAFGYVFAALAFRNDFMVSFMIFLMRVLDIPFAFVALLYSATGLKLQIDSGKDESDSPWSLVVYSVCILLFSLVVFVNLAFPSKL